MDELFDHSTPSNTHLLDEGIRVEDLNHEQTSNATFENVAMLKFENMYETYRDLQSPCDTQIPYTVKLEKVLKDENLRSTHLQYSDTNVKLEVNMDAEISPKTQTSINDINIKVEEAESSHGTHVDVKCENEMKGEEASSFVKFEENSNTSCDDSTPQNESGSQVMAAFLNNERESFTRNGDSREQSSMRTQLWNLLENTGYASRATESTVKKILEMLANDTLLTEEQLADLLGVEPSTQAAGDHIVNGRDDLPNEEPQIEVHVDETSESYWEFPTSSDNSIQEKGPAPSTIDPECQNISNEKFNSHEDTNTHSKKAGAKGFGCSTYGTTVQTVNPNPTASPQPGSIPGNPIAWNNNAMIHMSFKTPPRCRYDDGQPQNNGELVLFHPTMGVQMEINPPKKMRRTVLEPSEWKAAQIKKAHGARIEYTNNRRKHITEKQLGNACNDNCKRRCTAVCSEDERQRIFSSYYTLDTLGKWQFIANSTTRQNKVLRKHTAAVSRRQYSFRYFLSIEDSRTEVCRKFYLSTLAVSAKVVYSVAKKKDSISGVLGPDLRGSHPNSSRKMPQEQIQKAKDHIKSFHAVHSHYCRASSSKIYLEPYLNQAAMYRLYLAECQNSHVEPVKESYYRHLFCTEFNLDFHKSKKDQCDTCRSYAAREAEGKNTDEEKDSQLNHLREKTSAETKKAGDKTRLTGNDHLLICFDLQNVIACPKADISSVFYSRKLSVYNLTAYEATTKTGYCAIWAESTSGRAGNDLASAFIKILTRVVEKNPLVTEITIWSDSCVPHNRNSVISYAVQRFMQEHQHISTITMKYSVHGHGLVQEVDSIHSQLDAVFRVSEFFSPISLLGLILQARPSQPYVVIQMKPEDFRDYRVKSNSLNYSIVPYTQIAAISFLKNSTIVGFQKSFVTGEWTYVDVGPRARETRRAETQHFRFAEAGLFKKVCPLSKEKVKDLKKLLVYMPLQDREYYAALSPDLVLSP